MTIMYRTSGFCIRHGETWVFTGPSGCGKTTLARSIASTAENATYIGFEAQEALLNEERERDETDFINQIDPGRSVGDYLHGLPGRTPDSVTRALSLFGLWELKDQGIKYLSTGEMRKVLLAAAVIEEKEVLVLDDPYTSLDEQTRRYLSHTFTDLKNSGKTLVFFVNRLSEIPDYATHAALLHNGTAVLAGDTSVLHSPLFSQLYHLHTRIPDTLPGMKGSKDRLDPEKPLICLSDIHVSYHDRDSGVKEVFRNFSFRVMEGEHWKITGPNGVGKSTLLSLITGDHPQCYANDVKIFGISRGSGESIWDIKKDIGIVSSALQFDYRVRSSVTGTIISGFYDSIGMYTRHSPGQEALAREWLALLGMENQACLPFPGLSFGQKRLVLIARAMVKQPRLLILDEPCQGIDPGNRELVLQLIDIIASKGGATVLYVTHHQEDRVPSIKNHLALTREVCIR
ncbi:MAG: ATP-binding cassette domain-containing protein [Spirochaetales bacterium]|nr:ATP-binding cassette domain-containing protein [Spirochaetales bacterium]